MSSSILFIHILRKRKENYIIYDILSKGGYTCKLLYTLFKHMGVMENMNEDNKEVTKHVDKQKMERQIIILV